MDAKLQPARDAFVLKKFFDGVQLVNAALEELEDGLKAEGGEKSDILRTPEEYFRKVMPQMSDSQKADASKAFALRAELLVGLGAGKRAIVDLGAALLLVPGDEAIEKRMKGVEEQLKGAEGDNKASGKTPTTIITGFLGAGKTTLLNHILTENHGKRIAVIENEFGEVGIDDALLAQNSNVTEENIIEMNNGCICCTVRGDLIAGLKKLHKQAARKSKPLDGIIIETTGLANPAPVAQTFFADEFVQTHMQLDGILTVVDAKHVMEHISEVKPDGVVNEAVEQVAFADRILLNKTDLVEPAYLDELELELRAINKGAAIRRTENSKIDMDFIIGIQAFSLDKVLDQVQDDFLVAEEHGHGHGDEGHGHGHDADCGGCDDASHSGHGGHEGGHGGGHEAGCAETSCTDASHGGHGEGHGAASHGGHGDDCSKEGCDHASHAAAGKKRRHVHDYRVASVGISLDQEVHKDKLDTFLAWLMQVKGPDLFRSKGVLAVKGMKEKFVFQAVHMQFTGKPQALWGPDEKRCSKMVFIGKNLDRKEINEKFAECLVK